VRYESGPFFRVFVAVLIIGTALPVYSQDRNIALPVPELEQMLRSEPLQIAGAELSRPTARGDITLKADAVFGQRPPLRIKVRKADRGAESFNNVPRYDIAAYELQKLLMDEAEYVVPPTALRMVPVTALKPYAGKVKIRPTFRGSDDVLCVVQYWLQDVKTVNDIFDRTKFEKDAVYARHIGQLNVFTYLIEHADSNLGNFLVSTAPEGPRVFAIDNGIAFASAASDRGELWKTMRVDRLPADVVDRLGKLTEELLISRLSVVAQWELKDGKWVAMAHGDNLGLRMGVRRDDNILQMGLTRSEIAGVWSRVETLRWMIDNDKIAIF